MGHTCSSYWRAFIAAALLSCTSDVEHSVRIECERADTYCADRGAGPVVFVSMVDPTDVTGGSSETRSTLIWEPGTPIRSEVTSPNRMSSSVQVSTDQGVLATLQWESASRIILDGSGYSPMHFERILAKEGACRLDNGDGRPLPSRSILRGAGDELLLASGEASLLPGGKVGFSWSRIPEFRLSWVGTGCACAEQPGTDLLGVRVEGSEDVVLVGEERTISIGGESYVLAVRLAIRPAAANGHCGALQWSIYRSSAWHIDS